MNRNFSSKAKVTGKRQITIPKEICDILNIQNGDQVTFESENDKIIFGVHKNYTSCFACNGTGNIEKQECFVCKGTGNIETAILQNMYKLIMVISSSSRKYGVFISFIQQDLNFSKDLNFPIVKLEGPKYSEDKLSHIQDEIQKLIIKQCISKSTLDDSLLFTPSPSILKSVLATLNTEEAKEEVLNWF